MSNVVGRTKGWWDGLVSDIQLILRGNRFYKESSFSVRLISTWELEYLEGDHLLKVGTGIVNGSSRWWDNWVRIEVTDTLRWEPPYTYESISEEKKTQILNNIAKAYDDFKIPYEFVNVGSGATHFLQTRKFYFKS